ncbi:hypothetical protein ACLK19_19085 [Escherichia coli]
MVSIEWQELPVITTPEAALAEDAAPIQDQAITQSTMSTGNVQQNNRCRRLPGQGTIRPPVIQHCHMEKRNIAGRDGG